MSDMGSHPRPGHVPLDRNVVVLGWTSLLNDVASEMIFPLLPRFLIEVLGGNKVYLGAIEGVADSTASFLKLWSGGQSDRAGRRKGFVVFGYSLAVLTRPLIGLITAPWQLFAIRVADRLGKGVRTSPRDALVADSTPVKHRGRAFGFQRGMDHLGAAIGPLLAAAALWLWPGQYRPLFLATLVPGLLVLALLMLRLRESPPMDDPGSKPVGLTLRPLGSNFRYYLLALLVFSLGNSSDAFLLLRAGELGVAAPLVPVLWCCFHVVKSGGSLLAGRWIDRIGPRPVILASWLWYAGVYFGFAWAAAAWQMWALFLAYGVFYALSEPSEKTLVATLAGPERRGLAFGWYNFAVGVATLPASLMFGWLYQHWGALTAFGLGAILSLLAAAILALVRTPVTK
jgi:MFS family permease